MTFPYPAQCKTAAERLECALAAVEALRLEHNAATTEAERRNCIQRQKTALAEVGRYRASAGLAKPDATEADDEQWQQAKALGRASTRFRVAPRAIIAPTEAGKP